MLDRGWLACFLASGRSIEGSISFTKTAPLIGAGVLCREKSTEWLVWGLELIELDWLRTAGPVWRVLKGLLKVAESRAVSERPGSASSA